MDLKFLLHAKVSDEECRRGSAVVSDEDEQTINVEVSHKNDDTVEGIQIRRDALQQDPLEEHTSEQSIAEQRTWTPINAKQPIRLKRPTNIERTISSKQPTDSQQPISSEQPNCAEQDGPEPESPEEGEMRYMVVFIDDVPLGQTNAALEIFKCIEALPESSKATLKKYTFKPIWSHVRSTKDTVASVSNRVSAQILLEAAQKAIKFIVLIGLPDDEDEQKMLIEREAWLPKRDLRKWFKTDYDIPELLSSRFSAERAHFVIHSRCPEKYKSYQHNMVREKPSKFGPRNFYYDLLYRLRHTDAAGQVISIRVPRYGPREDYPSWAHMIKLYIRALAKQAEKFKCCIVYRRSWETKMFTDWAEEIREEEKVAERKRKSKLVESSSDER